ncbi:spermidine/putrescine transport system ATP-binding protein [Palleronia aestuarii]|uniref:Spermidine/putrescine import ATP-binding protein PotA n=1 Tax=Palleronia aestuarii TaxID=568105 RepID=A0A2W7PLU6_9RHOB|nr:ABC transporter ATP-binding protein [Palleronia aestuarii]PZX10289.1 spermidine/putrescine transport system ATP-binding protein [Palleronia aestuarii]
MAQVDSSGGIGIAVDVDDVVKRYGTLTALHGVSFDIRDGEFFTLLGPSGCGKTTLLRCIAGFEEVSGGAIRLHGEDIARLPPHRRQVNTVFQQYALFPHMDVLANVMFGLLRRGWTRRDATARAREVLALVRLADFAERRPAQLSGGQQQRVALARALAPGPQVLLLDEPLSALDLKLRQAVRVELKQIQRETDIAFVFVTHDQEEALTMSDRIAVMSDGRVQQIGTPREVYEAPVNRFVAGFIGETNLLDVAIRSVDGSRAEVLLPGGRPFACAAAAPVAAGPGHLSVRPERIELVAAGEGDLTATVRDHVYLGTDIQLHARLADDEAVVVRIQNAAGSAIPERGAEIGLKLEAGAARLLTD